MKITKSSINRATGLYTIQFSNCITVVVDDNCDFYSIKIGNADIDLSVEKRKEMIPVIKKELWKIECAELENLSYYNATKMIYGDNHEKF